MLVGQSGVGKSSLLRALVPESVASVGALLRDDEGRHTTTATRLYQLPRWRRASSIRPGCGTLRRRSTGSMPAALGFVEIAR